MFNWEKFKKGEIAVHCDTKEKAINFLKECDTQGVKWKCGGDLKSLTKWDFHERKTVYGCCDGDANLYYGTDIYYVEHDIPIIKWNIKEDNIEKTFREVIADIKEGEVWESRSKYIRRFNDGIQIYHKENGKATPSMLMADNDKFKLQRKEYTFEEAFKAYEEGKEIENILTGLKIKASVREGWGILPIINGELEEDVCSKTLSIEEVRTKWYINN